MMSDRSPEDLDPRSAVRLREFVDQPLAASDADRAARDAASERRHPTWLVLARAASVVLVVVVGVAVAGVLWSSGSGAEGPLTAGGPAVETALPSRSGASPDGTPAGGLTLEQAVAAARTAAPHRADAAVYSAEAGPFSDLLEPEVAYRISPASPAERWVWVINLASGPEGGMEGSMVVVDFIDGSVLGVIEWTS